MLTDERLAGQIPIEYKRTQMYNHNTLKFKNLPLYGLCINGGSKNYLQRV